MPRADALPPPPDPVTAALREMARLLARRWVRQCRERQDDSRDQEPPQAA